MGNGMGTADERSWTLIGFGRAWQQIISVNQRSSAVRWIGAVGFGSMAMSILLPVVCGGVRLAEGPRPQPCFPPSRSGVVDGCWLLVDRGRGWEPLMNAHGR